MSVFTKIINREIPANIEYEDDNVIVIHDINPEADVHLLAIPKQEITDIDAVDTDSKTLNQLFSAIQKVTRKLSIADNYNLKVNVGEKAGQEIMHLHIHILSNKNK